MPRITVAINSQLLAALDRLVVAGGFVNRSQAVCVALKEKLRLLQWQRLNDECAKLDPTCEQAMADEGLSADASDWPEY
jgi:metal-responsive CopG/Arc/MetJ family transcriptional regulator